MQIESQSVLETQTFGQAVGRQLKGGEVLVLVGDVGSGKTTFVKGLALGLDITETVQSPSFTISRTYQARDSLTLFHYDFYRLQEAGIMAEELQEKLNDPQAIVVMEWADIVDEFFPKNKAVLRFVATADDQRLIQIEPGSFLDDFTY